MLENFRRKSIEELGNQAKTTREKVGVDIIPPSLSHETEAILRMSESELKAKFPKRYEMYKSLLQAKKEGNEAVLDEIESKEMAKWFTLLNNLDRYITSHQEDTEGVRTLRDRQFTVFEDLRDFLEQGGVEGYIKLPTGAGKTVVFTEFVEALNLKTLIVVPTKILVKQTGQRLDQFAPGLDVGKIYDKAKQFGRQVTVITYASLVKQIEQGKINPDEYDCLILDEAHEALSKKRSGAISKFNKAIKMGFTATPFYSEDRNVGRLLNTEVHNMSVREAVENDVCCPFSVIVAKTSVDLSKVQIKSGDYKEDELHEAINVEGRNKAAVDLYLQMFKDKKAVLYAMGVKHAEKIAEMFIAHGVKAAVISGRMPSSQQEKLIQQYQDGEIKILCNADILIQGFDDPQANVCFNLRPTLSRVVAEQRGGRVLRLDPNDPKKHAFIVEFLDQNANKKLTPVTFAEVAEGAKIVSKNKEQGLLQEDPQERLVGTQPDIFIEGVEVVVDTEEVMRMVKDLNEQKYEKAPQGWMTNRALSIELGVGPESVKEIAERFRVEEHKEWFSFYLNPIKRLSEHYHPDLVAIIKKEISEREKAPEGWFTNTHLAKDLGVDMGTTSKIADKYRNEEHKEWFKYYFSTINRGAEHYHPDLIDLIKKEISEREVPPAGWMTTRALADRLEVASSVINLINERFRDGKHEKWFHYYLDGAGKLSEHLAPPLVKILKEEIGSRELAPEGWITNESLANELSVDRSNIANIADQYRDNKHTSWFHRYLDARKKLSEHYHPDLIDLIKKEIKSREPAPKGWMTRKSLKKQYNWDERTTAKISESFRSQHPRWFKSYTDPGGRKFEHWHPDLIEIIRKRMEKK